MHTNSPKDRGTPVTTYTTDSFFYMIEKIQVQRQHSPNRDGPISELERFFKSGSN